MLTNRTIEIHPPPHLAKHDFLFKSMTGWEGLGQPFWYDVELLSKDAHVDKLHVVGSSMTVVMSMDEGEPRYWNGVVTELTQAGWQGDFFTYRARLCPKLSMLALQTDSRIFQPSRLPVRGKKITVLDILRNVLLDQYGLVVNFEELEPPTGRWNEREYVVQYQESDLDFVQRLMEREGLYYYFRHADGKHEMVLADDKAQLYHEKQAYARIPYYPPNEGGSDRRARDHIDHWEMRKHVISGQYAAKDYDFEAPTAPRLSTTRSPISEGSSDQIVYEYPAGFPQDDHGDRGPRHEYVRRRLEEVQGDYERAVGAGTARGLMPGAPFGLVGYPGEPEERVFLVTWAHYDLATNAYTSSGAGGDGADYRVRFGAMHTALQYRPPLRTPRPTVKGPQTAIVTGTHASEIYADQYGRVKVKFHWDRFGNLNETSSCFVRVSQAWAGAEWGAMFMPRVGQEVIVDFLEGDPDQPIITGRVYNKDRMPPYNPETHGTVSTIKSMSSPEGGGFNELRFEDKKGSEQLFLHAQHRMDVRVVAGLYETVGGNREETVGHGSHGDLVRRVSGSVQLHAKGDQLELVDKRLHRNVKGEVVEVYEADQTTVVTGRQATNASEIAAEARQTLSLKADNVVVQGGQSLSLKAGNIKIEGTQGISLQVGGNFVVITPGGVFINGAMVMINSGGAPQPAGAPLALRDPSIEAPAEPAPADSALPGEHVVVTGTGSHGASRPVHGPRTVSLQRAPEPPALPVALAATTAPAGGREFIDIKWVEIETYCGGPATLQGTTRGYPDGSLEHANVRNAVDGATIAAAPLGIRNNAFFQPVEVRDWLPRRAGSDHETFRDEDAFASGKKTPRPLRVKFIPGLARARCTLLSPTHVASRFEMVVNDYECLIDHEIRYVKGHMAYLIQLGRHAPVDAGGQVGADFGPPDPNASSGSDWRFAKGDPNDRATMRFWDGRDWQLLPRGWKDTKFIKLFGIGIWVEDSQCRAQFAKKNWPDAIPPWSDADNEAAARVLPMWKRQINTTWTHKFDLRRDGCSSTDQSCCRYSVRVALKDFKDVASRTGEIIIIGVNDVRSNSGAWSIADPAISLAPHEFGHHLGNPDEYPGGGGVDASVNTDGARAGIDESCLMGSAPDDSIPPVKARHFDSIKRHLADMIKTQKKVAWAFRAVPRL